MPISNLHAAKQPFSPPDNSSTGTAGDSSFLREGGEIAKSENVPNWEPLEKKLKACHEPEETLTSFMWMRREWGVEFYKHIETGRYILLDSNEQCWRLGRQNLCVSDFARDLANCVRRT